MSERKEWVKKCKKCGNYMSDFEIENKLHGDKDTCSKCGQKEKDAA